MPEATLPPPPSVARQVVSALAVLALLGAIWGFVETRSAAPPPRDAVPVTAVYP